ncbi:MAG: aldolase/citrate lyase family protein, partial [Candidatus Omnitrophota bacterium]|nr:aldolase/citrate lyase family protein [Candidatus Omnitrophota bacterium]
LERAYVAGLLKTEAEEVVEGPRKGEQVSEEQRYLEARARLMAALRPGSQERGQAPGQTPSTDNLPPVRGGAGGTGAEPRRSVAVADVAQTLDTLLRERVAGGPSATLVLQLSVGRDVHLVGGSMEQAIGDAVAKRSPGREPAIFIEFVDGHEVRLDVVELGPHGAMTMHGVPGEGVSAVIGFVVSEVLRLVETDPQLATGELAIQTISVAVGGDLEEAPALAARGLLQEPDFEAVLAARERGESLSEQDAVRLQLFEAVNEALTKRFGVQQRWVLDVRLRTASSHVAGLPIAVKVEFTQVTRAGATVEAPLVSAQPEEAPRVREIPAEDIETSVAALVEHSAANLPEDFLRALQWGQANEQSPRGLGVYHRLLVNALEQARCGRPTCQDTGQTVVFVEVGQDAAVTGGTLEEAIQRGVARGYSTLRPSIVKDVLFDRRNTGDNTPAILHTRLVPGDTIQIHLAEKGYGSENKSSMSPITTLTDDGIVEQALALFKQAGVGDWCPPGMCSLAVDFDFIQAPLIAKGALLFESFRMDMLYARKDELFASYSEFFSGGTMDLRPEAYQEFLAAMSEEERRAFLQLREDVLTIRIFEATNATGIGPQGLGGTMAVLDVKFHLGRQAGGHTALNMQCNKAVENSVELAGKGPVTTFPTPDYESMLAEQQVLGARLPQQEPKRVEGPLTREAVAAHQLTAGDLVYYSGILVTARDAAHKRFSEALDEDGLISVRLEGYLEVLRSRGESPQPAWVANGWVTRKGRVTKDGRQQTVLVSVRDLLRDQLIYYVGPVARDPLRDPGAVGPAGPTTALRMSTYAPRMFEAGSRGMIGKGEISDPVIEQIQNHKAVYFIAIGGAAGLQAASIKQSLDLAFPDLGTEAVRVLRVKDFPITVAVDPSGTSIHKEGKTAFEGDQWAIPLVQIESPQGQTPRTDDLPSVSGGSDGVPAWDGRVGDSPQVSAGDNERHVRNAIESAARIVVSDLQDTVTEEDKDAAREKLIELIERYGEALSGKRIFVRLNHPRSPWSARDFQEVITRSGRRIDGIVSRYLQGPEDVQELDRLLTALEQANGLPVGRLEIMVHMDDLEALLRAEEIARASPRVSALIFSLYAYIGEVGAKTLPSVREPFKYLLWAKLRTAQAARRAGVAAIDGLTPAYRDSSRTIAEAAIASLLGYTGKWIIAPWQIHAMLNPVSELTDEDREWMRRMLALLAVEAPDIVEDFDAVVERLRSGQLWRQRPLSRSAPTTLPPYDLTVLNQLAQEGRPLIEPTPLKLPEMSTERSVYEVPASDPDLAQRAIRTAADALLLVEDGRLNRRTLQALAALDDGGKRLRVQLPGSRLSGSRVAEVLAPKLSTVVLVVDEENEADLAHHLATLAGDLAEFEQRHGLAEGSLGIAVRVRTSRLLLDAPEQLYSAIVGVERLRELIYDVPDLASGFQAKGALIGV